MLPKIVVLDGHTLSPLQPGENSASEPSWEGLASLGDFTLHARTPASEVAGRAEGAQILLTNKALVTAETIHSLPDLAYIGVMATGTNIVDLAAAKERGIVVTNVPGYSTNSVAQIVFSLLFELCGRTGETAQAVRSGRWAASPDFCFTLSPWTELAGKKFGIVGLGAIGAAVARVAHAMEMEVLVHSRTEKPTPVPVSWVSLEVLLATADVISLHCPLTPETDKFINADSLARMKPGAFLINTGRGPLLDEAAVADSLRAGHLGGLGADVLSKEPPPVDHPLLTAPRTVITPHIAWASIEARQRLMQEVTENVRAFLAGSPRNRVA
jgi:glycerate dehydrogenase